MLEVRPVSELRNNYTDIEKLIQEQEVCLTKNGVGVSVIMSIEDYNRLQAKIDIYQKLGEAEADIQNGDKGLNFREGLKVIREKYNG